jgi:ADP-heptose:LPS heptosyltransferase
MSFARLAGARWGAGWTFQSSKLWPRLQSECRQFPNQVERLLAIVRREGITPGSVEFGFPETPEVEGRASSMLTAMRLSPDAALVALAPGAKRTTNRWFPERFGEVGQYLTRQGYRVILVGAASDRELCESIASAIGEGAVSIAGRTDIPLLAALLRRCRLLIAVDSGVLHIAAAVGTPCVSIFSARDFHGRWHPYGVHRVIEKRVPCHTCLVEHCPNNNWCMREITVREVKMAAQTLMAQPTSTGGTAKADKKS